MNHCLDCNSTYTTPGTCNCFAPGGKRELKVETVAGTAANRCPFCTLPYRVPDGGSAATCRCHEGTTVTWEPDGSGATVRYTSEATNPSTSAVEMVAFINESIREWTRCGGNLPT